MTKKNGKKRNVEKASGPETAKAPQIWPGMIWECWDDDNQSRTPNYLLVTKRDEIDAPIALIYVPHFMLPQDGAAISRDLLSVAIAIAKNPDTIPELDAVRIQDLRQCGRRHGGPVPDILDDLHCAPLGTFDDSASKCEPYDRFAFARLLGQLAAMAFGPRWAKDTRFKITVAESNSPSMVFDVEKAELV